MALATPPDIRRAVSSDAAELRALQQSVYDEENWFVGDGPLDIGGLTRRIRSLEPSNSLYLVAQAPSSLELIAWLELHRLLPQKLKHVATLTLAVQTAYRGQGVARQLLKHAYTWSNEVGVLKITLNVRANNTAAIRLYERQGFELEGREKAHIRLKGSFEDNLIMAKGLNESLFLSAKP